MSLLRQNKDTLMGVLEPFIRDPTVSWGRSGRAQRTESVTKGPIGAIQDNDNTDAKEALLKIMERLNGVYNLCHPSGEDVILSLHFFLHSFFPAFFSSLLFFFLPSFIPLLRSPSLSLLALSSCPIYIAVLVLFFIY
jgi:phosphatidylinositol kinase/protein kinase (PI-3  family)